MVSRLTLVPSLFFVGIDLNFHVNRRTALIQNIGQRKKTRAQIVVYLHINSKYKFQIIATAVRISFPITLLKNRSIGHEITRIIKKQ